MSLSKDERKDLSELLRNVAAKIHAASVDIRREDVPFQNVFFDLTRARLDLQQIQLDIVEKARTP